MKIVSFLAILLIIAGEVTFSRKKRTFFPNVFHLFSEFFSSGVDFMFILG